MSASRIKKFAFIVFALATTFVFKFPTRIFAGGGPQIYCKEIALKQGWLMEKSQNTNNLSSDVCMTRDQTSEEKAEFVKFCKQESTEDFRNDCLNKCSKYYSYTTNEYQYCSKTEIFNKKVSTYFGNIVKFLNSGTFLATFIITLITVVILYGLISIIKKNKQGKREKD